MIKRLLIAVALLCAVSNAQVTVAPILQPHQTFVDQSGSPCAGCKLYSYTAGTTIPTPTYTDASGAIANTNPVVLSVQGGANIWVDTGVAYKYVLKNTIGATIWTVDHITGPLTNAILANPSGSQNITQSPGTNFDVETSGGGKFIYNGSEVLNKATGVQLNPTGTQTVNQPAGSTLAVSSLNGVLNAALFPGADIGEKVNAAYAAAPANGAQIIIPSSPTCYSFTTPIVFNVAAKNVLLTGEPGNIVCLVYTPTTGTAITMATTQGATSHNSNGAGISGINLSGPGRATATFGIQIGSTVLSQEGFVGRDVLVQGFGTGVTWSAPSAVGGTFFTLFDHSYFTNNGIAWLWPSTYIGPSGENMTCSNCLFGVDSGSIAGQIQVLGSFANFNFSDSSFDNAQILINNGSSTIHTSNCHHETIYNTTDPFVLVEGGSYAQVNAQFQYDPPSGTFPPHAVDIFGGPNVAFTDYGSWGYSNTTIPAMWFANAGGGAMISSLGNRQAIGFTTILAKHASFTGKATYQAKTGEISTVGQLSVDGGGFKSTNTGAPITLCFTITGNCASFALDSAGNLFVGDDGTFFNVQTNLQVNAGASITSSDHLVQTTSTGPTGTCTPNGFITATFNGATVKLATCP